jgi:hypothetical protein
MKKIILILVLWFSLFAWNSVFANSSGQMDWNSIPSSTDGKTDAERWQMNWASVSSNTSVPPGQESASTSSSTSGWNWIEVKVTEKIPWAECDWAPGAYTCTVKPGFGTVMELMWWIIKYFTFLASLGWVLFIVINWIMLSMWGMWWNKDEIKKRITMTIWWLILLLLSGLILHSIAPWIYQ